MISPEKNIADTGSKSNISEYSLNSLYIYITRYCNLRCCHCWLNPPHSDTASGLSDELTVNELTDLVDAALPLGLSSVKLTGGEPLLREDLPIFLEFCKKRDISVIIETNGTLIDEKVAAMLRKTQVELISVSLDGANSSINDEFRQAPGAFEKAVCGIKNLVNEGFDVQIITCLHRKNVEHFDAFLELMRDVKADYLKINVINNIGRAELGREDKKFLSVREVLDFAARISVLRDEFPFVIDLDIPSAFKKIDRLSNGCACGIFGILGILSSGEVSICGIGTHIKDLVFGSVKGDSLESMRKTLKDIWHDHPKLKELRREVPVNFQGICGQCVMKNRCLGKCRAESYYHNNDFTSPDWFCQAAFDKGLFPNTRLIPKEHIKMKA